MEVRIQKRITLFSVNLVYNDETLGPVCKSEAQVGCVVGDGRAEEEGIGVPSVPAPATLRNDH